MNSLNAWFDFVSMCVSQTEPKNGKKIMKKKNTKNNELHVDRNREQKTYISKKQNNKILFFFL